MKIVHFFKNLFIKSKRLDLTILPSQSYFYDDSFTISIKKAKLEDIKEYEVDFVRNDLSLILRKVKRIVKKNTIIPDKYNFEYIKSIDIIFIFFEIVKLTRNKKIDITYFDEYGSELKVDFSPKSFNYYNFDNILSNWNKKTKEFLINGYKYSLPSMGVENSLTQFLINKSYEEDCERYNEYKYSFVYFVGNKEYLTADEIENLIQIFNYDMDSDEIEKVDNIIKSFSSLQRYTLKKEDKIIEITSRINLETIWN
jgi:hypothetical protein